MRGYLSLQFGRNVLQTHLSEGGKVLWFLYVHWYRKIHKICLDYTGVKISFSLSTGDFTKRCSSFFVFFLTSFFGVTFATFQRNFILRRNARSKESLLDTLVSLGTSFSFSVSLFSYLYRSLKKFATITESTLINFYV